MRALPFNSPDLDIGDVVMLGVPWDEKSSHIRGAAAAPAAIRACLHSGVSNYCSESLCNLYFEDRFVDMGDLELSTGNIAMDEISAAVTTLLERGVKIISLGGDHAVAYPIIRAFANHFAAGTGKLDVLQIDAHPDLYDEIDGDRYSHGCPFARLMEVGTLDRLVQVGIRGNSPHQRHQAEKFGVEMIDMRAWGGLGMQRFFKSHGLSGGRWYISLDLDGIDPANAPGVAHPEPGGLTSREVIEMIQRFPGELVGAEIVELIPSRDVNGITTLLAMTLVKELAARMLED